MSEGTPITPPSDAVPAPEKPRPYILELNNRPEQRAISNLLGEYVTFHDRLAQRAGLTEQGMRGLNFSRSIATRIDENLANQSPESERISITLSTDEEQREIRGALAFRLTRLT